MANVSEQAITLTTPEATLTTPEATLTTPEATLTTPVEQAVHASAEKLVSSNDDMVFCVDSTPPDTPITKDLLKPQDNNLTTDKDMDMDVTQAVDSGLAENKLTTSVVETPVQKNEPKENGLSGVENGQAKVDANGNLNELEQTKPQTKSPSSPIVEKNSRVVCSPQPDIHPQARQRSNIELIEVAKIASKLPFWYAVVTPKALGIQHVNDAWVVHR